jgi:condensin complex subunit 1
MVSLVSNNNEGTDQTEVNMQLEPEADRSEEAGMVDVEMTDSAKSQPEKDDEGPMSSAEVLSQEPLILAGEGMPTEAELRNLRGLLRYYSDGISFIKQFESAVPLLVNLLASNIKGEVVEAMRFFVMAYRYEIESAQVILYVNLAISNSYKE